MKTDRELLELAAKACGIKPAGYNEEYGLHVDYTEEEKRHLCIGVHGYQWNPLDPSTGEGLRLAVKLGMHLGLEGPYRNAWIPGNWQHFASVPDGDDPDAAACRAIVQVAAMLGETMQ